MDTEPPDRDAIEYLRAIENFLMQQWESTRDSKFKEEIEAIATEIRRRRDSA